MRAWFVVMLAGCFDPKPPAGVPCSTAAPCPGEQTCVAGVCDGDAPTGDGPGAGSDVPRNGNGDTCETAIVLDLSVTTSGDLSGASDDFDPPADCGGTHPGIEQVYVVPLSSPRSFTLQVNANGFDGVYYTSQSCPPTSFNTCGSINNTGSSTGSSYSAGNVYLVIEQTDGTGGLTFEIVPKP